jgi:hypothetical protein
MCFDIQTIIVIERISQFEKDVCRCSGTKEYEQSRNAHGADRNTIKESSLMPHSSHWTDDECEACEYGSDNKGSFEPSGAVLKRLNSVDFWLYKDNGIRLSEFIRHDPDRIEGIAVVCITASRNNGLPVLIEAVVTFAKVPQPRLIKVV